MIMVMMAGVGVSQISTKVRLDDKHKQCVDVECATHVIFRQVISHLIMFVTGLTGSF
jgi:hypothetical protein